MTPRTVALLGVILTCVACDQGTKRVAAAYLAPGERISLLGDTVRLERTYNTGAFLGLGATLPDVVRRHVFTSGVALITLGALVVAFRRRTPSRVALAAALLAGGALGNLWDRLTQGGRVLDFMNAGVGWLRTGIFNVADVAIVAGALLLVLQRRPVRTGGPR